MNTIYLVYAANGANRVVMAAFTKREIAEKYVLDWKQCESTYYIDPIEVDKYEQWYK